jgi:nucleoid-associated protein YgaU
MSAMRASAVRASASQLTAKRAPARPEPVTQRTVATGSRPDRRRQARPAAVRLTRRGRGVVAGLALALTAAVVVLIWLAAAGAAAAANHGLPARTVYQGLTQVVVRPGQTLWAIAAAAEPTADPRVVIQQIIETNALSGATIHAGQLLWVPNG